MILGKVLWCLRASHVIGAWPVGCGSFSGMVTPRTATPLLHLVWVFMVYARVSRFSAMSPRVGLYVYARVSRFSAMSPLGGVIYMVCILMPTKCGVLCIHGVMYYHTNCAVSVASLHRCTYVTGGHHGEVIELRLGMGK